jgi:hypothetical protein
VTKQRIEGRIASVDYHCLGATVTLCNVTLDNGYSVRGESACVDPATSMRRSATASPMIRPSGSYGRYSAVCWRSST